MPRTNLDMPDFPKLPLFFKLWFAFCALMGISAFVGVAYVIYKVCKHFGIM